MASGRLIVPHIMPAADSNGRRLSGALLYVYQNRTTTLASVYADAGLATPLTNPVEADSSGVFPQIWADGDALYSVAATKANGAPIPRASFDDVEVSVASVTAEDGITVGSEGFWTDDPGALVVRIPDRLFVGDAVDHTGGRFGTGAGLGSDWLTTRGANYFTKNGRALCLATNRIGLVAGSHTPVGESSVVNMGLGGVTLNEGVNSTGRALYAEAFHMPTGGGGATVGLEIQGGNYTSVDPNPTSYGIGTGYHGLYVGVEAGRGYVLGDDNTAIATPTYAAGAAMDVAGGSLFASYQRWKAGIIFRNGALYRGTDGLTGNAVAIDMANKHQIIWRASSSLLGATLRSDVTAVAGSDVGLIFANNSASLTGASEAPIMQARHVSGGVNYFVVENAATGGVPAIRATGSDTNVNFLLQTKGTGVFVFNNNAGTTEVLRVEGPASPANRLHLQASGTTGPVVVGAIGTDTDIDVAVTPKGAGRMRYGTHTASADAPITGYIEIKDSAGNIRKLAVIS